MGALRGTAGEYNDSSDSLIGMRVTLSSGTSVDINANNDININGSNVKFNLRDEDSTVSTVSVIEIIEKMVSLQNEIDALKSGTQPAMRSISKSGLQVEDTGLTFSDEEYDESKFTVSDNTAESEDNTPDDPKNDINSDYIQNLFVSVGIILIKGILAPRAKKPEESGYYLKQNKAGNIQNYVFFDGNDYTDTMKCESGKIYSVNGLIYAFNGETCELLGSQKLT